MNANPSTEDSSANAVSKKAKVFVVKDVLSGLVLAEFSQFEMHIFKRWGLDKYKYSAAI
ncbi:hypothetical protein [Alteromonas sp. a30]|uniref:hypothetical protein n=1 Tax=Alteromonas sp. a30 TaxID=2730917 RepID=UPI00227F68FC|nr:hypothetical protein [Alteromonas sp. a30]MCY7296956.1 hypothetical protein [Alteromonas sp. a30]